MTPLPSFDLAPQILRFRRPALSALGWKGAAAPAAARVQRRPILHKHVTSTQLQEEYASNSCFQVTAPVR